MIVPGQHRRRGRRLRLRRGLPVDDRRRPGHDRDGRRVGPRRARRRAASPGSAACPTERRVHADDGTMVLRLPRVARLADRRASTRRSMRTSSSSASPAPTRGSSCCGHTHLPEVRDLGWKIIVNDGSRRLRLRRRPDGVVGARSTVDGDEVTAEIRRTEFDTLAVAERDLRPRPAGRRLSRRHGPHGQARPMSRRATTGRPTPRRRDRDGALTALGNDVASTWEGLVAGRSGVRDDRVVRSVAARPPGSPARSATSTPSHVLDRKDLRRIDRYIQFGLVAARQALDQAGLPERFEGELAERTGVILGTGPRRRRDARRRASRSTRCAARTGSARSSSRWASRTSAPARSRSASG